MTATNPHEDSAAGTSPVMPARPLGHARRTTPRGLDRGLAGPGDVTGAAAGPGHRPGRRARAHHGPVLRHRLQPDAALGAPPAGRRPGRRPGGPGPGWDAIVIGECERAFCGGLRRRLKSRGAQLAGRGTQAEAGSARCRSWLVSRSPNSIHLREPCSGVGLDVLHNDDDLPVRTLRDRVPRWSDHPTEDADGTHPAAGLLRETGRQVPGQVLRVGEKSPRERRSEAVAAVLRARPRSCPGNEEPGHSLIPHASASSSRVKVRPSPESDRMRRSASASAASRRRRRFSARSASSSARGIETMSWVRAVM